MEDRHTTGILKYIGPDVKDGSIDTEKLAKALLGLNDAFRKISNQNSDNKRFEPFLKVSFKKGSFEIVASIAAGVYVAKEAGLLELGKQFFGEVGRQLALKKFAKNGDLTKDGRPEINDGKMYVVVINKDGDRQKINAVSYNLFERKILNNSLAAIVSPLEKDKIEKVQCINFNNSDSQQDIVEISETDTDYYKENETCVLESDYEGDFESNNAEKIDGMTGRLVSYQALASKYPFNFQPREQQRLYGKRFIPCMINDPNKMDEYIELMKSYIGNVIIRGVGIKDESGRYSRIKIYSIEKDEENLLV